MSRVLITGADGYLGRALVEWYLAQTDAALTLTVRATDVGELSAKQIALENVFGAQVLKLPRVEVVPVDFATPNAMDAIDPVGITSIIHGAAITRFNVEEELARTVNLGGAIQILKFAQRCDELTSLGLLSTIYSAGLASGIIEETSSAGMAGFANFYEWSKWESEHSALLDYGDLPTRVMRIATVIADDDTGVVSQQNAFHNTLRLFFYGLLSLLPGDREVPVYFVTRDFAAETVAALMAPGVGEGIFHVCHTKDESLTLGELVDLAFSRFNADGNFGARGILKPLFCDLESFDALVEGAKGFKASVLAEAMASIEPFARQLYVNKNVINDRTVAALGGTYRAMDPRDLVAASVDWLVSTRWGKSQR